MMKNIRRGLFLIGSLLLLGCTQLRDQQNWTIKNDSTNDIFVEFTHEFNSEIRLDTIGVGEERLMCYMDGMVYGQDLEDPTLFTYMYIYNSTDTLVKDENLITNWEVTSEKIRFNNDAMRYEYKFSVNDSDF